MGHIKNSETIVSTLDTISSIIGNLLKDEGLAVPEIARDKHLIDDIGLDSLNLAQLIALLEMELEKDPFTEGDVAITDIQTVGDLANAYDD